MEFDVYIGDGNRLFFYNPETDELVPVNDMAEGCPNFTPGCDFCDDEDCPFYCEDLCDDCDECCDDDNDHYDDYYEGLEDINDFVTFVRLTIKDVIFNDPATIVKWIDGTKTVVVARDGDVYNKDFGLMACILKKCAGCSGRWNDILKDWCYKDEEDI